MPGRYSVAAVLKAVCGWAGGHPSALLRKAQGLKLVNVWYSESML